MAEETKTTLSGKELRDRITDAQMDVWRVASRIQHRLKELAQAGKIKFDWNGHHRRRVTQPTAPPDYTWEFRRDFGLEESVLSDCVHGFFHEDIEAANKIFALFDNPGEYLPLYKMTFNAGCYSCGQDVPVAFNGTTVRATEKCKFPDGMPPITAMISVPSGKLVFTNYFVDVEPPTDDGRFRGALGYKLETKHYAKYGIAYGACGNSCPSILRNAEKDKIIVGKVVYDEKDDKKVIDGFTGYTRVGGVITDLWAWSATDYDNALKIGWEQTKNKFCQDDVVKVIPGKYRVSQLFHQVDYDNYKVKHKFATIERVGR